MMVTSTFHFHCIPELSLASSVETSVAESRFEWIDVNPCNTHHKAAPAWNIPVLFSTVQF